MLSRELVEDLDFGATRGWLCGGFCWGFVSVARDKKFETNDSPCGVEELDVVN